MSRQEFTVHMEVDVTISVDDAVISAVNDEWRQQFYPLHTPQEIAEHLVWNHVVNHARLSHLDGWADQPDSNMTIVSED